MTPDNLEARLLNIEKMLERLISVTCPTQSSPRSMSHLDEIRYVTENGIDPVKYLRERILRDRETQTPKRRKKA